MPDGLLLGLIGLLLGITVLVWTAHRPGRAVRARRAGRPDVHFTRTPLAMRALIGTQPHDLTRAWPRRRSRDLPGPGLFWGILIGAADGAGRGRRSSPSAR